MRTRFRNLMIAAVVFAAIPLILPLRAENPPVPAKTTEKSNKELWQSTVDKAYSYLKTNQEENGGWGTKKSIGFTGIVVTGMLECGKSPDDAVCDRGLKFIESLVNKKEGHIAGTDPKLGLQNYVTSINVMALAAVKREDKYKSVIGNAVTFLKKLQWDEGEKKDPKDDFYGGAGYDSKSRPDLSNTQFFIDALKAGGVDDKDKALEKALIFVSRCQNFKSEKNDLPWAGKINDGSFIYSAAGGGQTKTSDDPNAPLTGYGSMTYAGVKSMIYCGVTKSDDRMKKAVEWLRANYTTEMNPGMPKELGSRGLYYYYHTMAKTLELLGEDEFVDSKGIKHDWRSDILQALAKRQKADGSWVNETDKWMEGDSSLVTGYVLMALSHCKPK